MGNVKIIVALRAILMNKIASLQPIQYGVSIDFLLLDFTKESMHWKLIPSYIQKFHFVDVIAMDNLLIRQKYAVTKIVLFGSRARGTNTERSDVDIAIYGGDFDSFYWDVKENIHSLLMFDVVQADASISDELKKEIAKDGVVIYEKA